MSSDKEIQGQKEKGLLARALDAGKDLVNTGLDTWFGVLAGTGAVISDQTAELFGGDLEEGIGFKAGWEGGTHLREDIKEFFTGPEQSETQNISNKGNLAERFKAEVDGGVVYGPQPEPEPEPEQTAQGPVQGPVQEGVPALQNLNRALSTLGAGAPLQGASAISQRDLAEQVKNQLIVLKEKGDFTEADAPEGFWNKFNSQETDFSTPENIAEMGGVIEKAVSRHKAAENENELEGGNNISGEQSQQYYEYDAGVMEMQSYLYMLGYGDDVQMVDGMRGRLTNAALAQYAEDHDFPLAEGQSIESVSDQEMLGHLYNTVQTPANQALILKNAQAALADPSNTDAVKAAQMTMNVVGGAGTRLPPTGEMTEDTQTALERFDIKLNGAATAGLMEQGREEAHITDDAAFPGQAEADTGAEAEAEVEVEAEVEKEDVQAEAQTVAAEASIEAAGSDFAREGSLVIDDKVEDHVRQQIAAAVEKGALSNPVSELSDKSFLTVKNGTPFVARYENGELAVRQVTAHALEENNVTIDTNSVVMDPKLIDKISNRAMRQAGRGRFPDGDTRIGRVDFDLDWERDPANPDQISLMGIKLDEQSLAERQPIKARFETTEVTLSDGRRFAVDTDDLEKSVHKLSREFNNGDRNVFGGNYNRLGATIDQVRDGQGGGLARSFNQDSYGTSAEMDFASGQTVHLPQNMMDTIMAQLEKDNAEMQNLPQDKPEIANI